MISVLMGDIMLSVENVWLIGRISFVMMPQLIRTCYIMVRLKICLNYGERGYDKAERNE